MRKTVTDSSILEEFLAIHHAPGGKVADLSAGDRKLWTQALIRQYQPVFVDGEASKQPDIVGDWTTQHEYFAEGSVATEVWDPPMLSDAGATGLVGGRVGGWGRRYGTRGPGLKGPLAVIEQVVPFLDSAAASLEPRRGTLIIKMADQVKTRKLRFQPYYTWLLAISRGWYACDRKERIRAQPRHNTTIVQEHIRRGTTHWLVFHNFEGCPGSGIDRQRRCPGCGELYPVTRPNRRSCGTSKCRMAALRIRQQPPRRKRHASDRPEPVAG